MDLTISFKLYIVAERDNTIHCPEGGSVTANRTVQKIPGKRVTPSKFRAKMGDFFARVQYGNETIVVVTRG